jgi:choline dehydrogenase-like flavoprotein
VLVSPFLAKSPDRGVVNLYQQHWDISNPFKIGASTIHNSGAANPTPTILALTYRTADTIVDKYLKKPGMLGRSISNDFSLWPSLAYQGQNPQAEACAT